MSTLTGFGWCALNSRNSYCIVTGYQLELRTLSTPPPPTVLQAQKAFALVVSIQQSSSTSKSASQRPWWHACRYADACSSSDSSYSGEYDARSASIDNPDFLVSSKGGTNASLSVPGLIPGTIPRIRRKVVDPLAPLPDHVTIDKPG